MKCFWKNEKIIFSFLGALLFVACSHETKVAEGTTEENNAYIVVDGSDVDVTNGTWSTINGGDGSKIVWPEYSGVEYSVEWLTDVSNTCGGICGKVVLDSNSSESESFTGVRLDMARKTSQGTAYADVSGWESFCLTYASEMDMDVELNLGETENAKVGYDLPAAKFEKTLDNGVVTRCKKWNEFKQKSANEITGEYAAKRLKAVDIKFVGAPGATGEFLIKKIDDSGVSAPKDSVAKDSAAKDTTASEPVPEDSAAVNDTLQDVIHGGSDFLEGDSLDYLDDEDLSKWPNVNAYRKDAKTEYDSWDYGYMPLEGLGASFYWEFDQKGMSFTNSKVEGCEGICLSTEISNSEEDAYSGIIFYPWKDGPVDVSAFMAVYISYESDVPLEVELGVSEERGLVSKINPVSSLSAESGFLALSLLWEGFKTRSEDSPDGETAVKNLYYIRVGTPAKSLQSMNLKIKAITLL